MIATTLVSAHCVASIIRFQVQVSTLVTHCTRSLTRTHILSPFSSLCLYPTHQLIPSSLLKFTQVDAH